MSNGKSNYKVKQFRYFGDSNAGTETPSVGQISNLENTSGLTASTQLASGAIFEGYVPILKIGIQTIPGVSFYLNGSVDPIIIGLSGMYELDLQDTDARITSLQFNKASLSVVNSSPGGYLIIDIMYEGREGINK